MIKHTHVPNLFLIVGQPDNGKTTISDCFERVLGCEVIHTDQLYHAWITKNYPEQLKSSKHNIRGHYPKMTKEWQREWNEYAADCIITALQAAKLDLVVEGWLMLYLPDDLKTQIAMRANVLRIHMRRFVACVGTITVRTVGRDYTKAVHHLCAYMAQSEGVRFMRRLVRYQSFEDIRDFQGSSDSAGKLLALKLPADMTDKKVLDVGCSTGYFALRCAQRGAKAVGIDKKYSNIDTAARLASAVYRTTVPRFYHCNFFALDTPWKFDYILAVNILSHIGNDLGTFFTRAYDLLEPGGTLVIETGVSCVKPDHPQRHTPHLEIACAKGKKSVQYPNEKLIAAMMGKFTLTYRGRSVRMQGDKRRRVYHFQRPAREVICVAPEPSLCEASV